MRTKTLVKIILFVGLIFCASFFVVRAKKAHAPKDKNIPATVIPPLIVKAKYHLNKDFDLVPNDTDGNKKVLLITIDDGPTLRAPLLMDTLEKHNAKAIFFINGMHDRTAPGIIAEEARRGFAVGNHTWSHANLRKEKEIKSLQKEIDDTTKLITERTGSLPRFFRPPYGESTAYVRDLVKTDDMIYMNWSGAAMDWQKNTQDEKIFLANVDKGLHPGEVLLIHEHPWTVKYLDSLLTTLEEKGYTFIDPSQITQ